MSLDPMSIGHIVSSVKQLNTLSIPKEFLQIKNDGSVCVTTTGECEFVYGVEQNVNTTTTAATQRNLYPPL